MTFTDMATNPEPPDTDGYGGCEFCGEGLWMDFHRGIYCPEKQCMEANY